MFRAEAVNEPFNLVQATTNFPRPKSEPNLTAPAPPTPVMRQPRANPLMLGDSSVGGTNLTSAMSVREARQEPGLGTMSLSSLAISQGLGGTASSVSSVPPATAAAGLSALLCS